MDLEQLRQILDLVKQHDLSEFELENEGLRLRIRAGVAAAPAVSAPSVAPAVRLTAPAAATDAQTELPAAASAAPGPGPGPIAAEEVNLTIVKSPIVGTFYRSPEPNAAAFVEVGSTVKKGQVLCIIEAMKLMNEIDSEYDGEVVSVYAQTGQPVQYGERLFAIRTL